jgi:phage repressor protein C with HTH and peptisase S24 domain
MEISDRIINKMTELRLKGVDIEKLVGVSSGTVSMWRSGTTSPSGKNLVRLAKVLRVSESWITTGKSEGPNNAGGLNTAPYGEDPSIGRIMSPSEAEANYGVYSSEIPLLQIDGSCGAGSTIDCEPLHTAKLIKEDNWFKRYKVKPRDAFAVYAKGDSMEMFIVDGDIVIFDKSKTVAKSSGIFLIRHPDGLKIKRLKQSITGDWLAVSLNDKYSPEAIPKDLINEIQILGQFIYRQGG